MQFIQKQNYLTRGKNHTSEGQNDNIIKLIQGNSLFTTTPFAKYQIVRQVMFCRADLRHRNLYMCADDLSAWRSCTCWSRRTPNVAHRISYCSFTATVWWNDTLHQNLSVKGQKGCQGGPQYCPQLWIKDVKKKKKIPLRAVKPNHPCVPRVPQKLQ